MKKTILTLFAFSLLLSCANNEEKAEDSENQENVNNEKEEINKTPEAGMYPYFDIYGNDSVDANGNPVYGTAEEVGLEVNKEIVPQVDSVSGREYTLGPRPDTPITNIYGEDSISNDGNYVYPAQDTIWVIEKDQAKK